MEVHIGKIIKEAVKFSGMTVTEFADKVHFSRRNVYEIFEKPTIDTGVLIKIGKVLKKNLFLSYISDAEIEKRLIEKGRGAVLSPDTEKIYNAIIELQGKLPKSKPKKVVKRTSRK